MIQVRVDLFLSYWIFAWVALFILNIVSYSPKLILVIVFWFSIYEVNVLSDKRFFKYNIMNIITKLVAIALVIHSSIDIIPTIVFIVVYLVYIYANKLTFVDLYGRKAILSRADKKQAHS